MLRATFRLNDGRLRIKAPVIRKNEHTVWVVIAGRERGRPFSKPKSMAIKRHIKKDNIKLSEG